jgi:hypothetical protein
MTKEEIAEQLTTFKVLGLLIGALIQEPTQRERSLFSLERFCGRPLREFLVEADPDEDPALYWQAIQAVAALREDQIWIARFHANQTLPMVARWS